MINKVQEANILTLDLAEFVTIIDEDKLVSFDIKNFLYKELILKEKEFRESLKTLDWACYHKKRVLVHCSTEAIIPVWAYMLIAKFLHSVTSEIFYGSKDDFLEQFYIKQINNLSMDNFIDKRIIVKGCGKIPLTPAICLSLTLKLMPIAKSIFYGEPCSNVPIYKR